MYVCMYVHMYVCMYVPYSVKLLTVEKSDEFDECMLNRQSFPYQNFTLRKSQYCIFYGYNLLPWVCQELSCYVGTWNVEVLSSISVT